MPTKKPGYMLMPCSGRARLNIPRGHLYEVRDRADGKKLGFITEQTANKNYGKGNYLISASDSLCPICYDDIQGKGINDLIEPKED